MVYKVFLVLNAGKHGNARMVKFVSNEAVTTDILSYKIEKVKGLLQ